MNNKGHVLLECVLSLSITLILFNTMMPILTNSMKLNNSTEEKLEMMSILNEQIEDCKSKIARCEINDNVSLTKCINESDVKINITKDIKYSESYYIDIEVSKGGETLNIESYETR